MRCLWSLSWNSHRVVMRTLILLLQLEGSPGHLLLSTGAVSSQCFKVSVCLWIPRTATSDTTPQSQRVVLQVSGAIEISFKCLHINGFCHLLTVQTYIDILYRSI